MKRAILFFLMISITLIFPNYSNCQSLEPIPLNKKWIRKIEKLAPVVEKKSDQTKNILVFSLHTGFEHWVIPHTEKMVEIVAEKSGLFNIETSKDIHVFEKDNLEKFDAIVLNNTCPQREKRDIFWDVINEMDMTEDEKVAKAEALQENLLEFVQNGGGLVVLHGAITFLNKSEKFGEMVGGSFDYHPPQQEITVKVSDPSNPITAPFKGQNFVHIDEPYFFMGAYEKKNFTPLLYFEIDKITDVRQEYESNINYIAWTKPYGDGHVFYSALSHNAQTFENKAFLAFILEGMKYSVGL